ncbi:MAG: hypothetical protein MK212_04810 [Saprospiraceae bacterium]|nr:hypothetical protein [Saprospiraceae bacterium]
MKKLIQNYLLVAVLVLLTKAVSAQFYIGDWKIESWSTDATPQEWEEMETKISIDKDGTFSLEFPMGKETSKWKKSDQKSQIILYTKGASEEKFQIDKLKKKRIKLYPIGLENEAMILKPYPKK